MIIPENYIELALDDGPTAPSPTWANFTSRVLGISRSGSGRQGGTDDVSGGSIQVLLRDDDRVLDPQNADGPHFGKLRPMRRLRWRWPNKGSAVAHETLTLSGNEITEASRALAAEGDGRPYEPFDFHSTFETGDDSEWSKTDAADLANQFAVVSSPVAGARIRVHPGDVAAGGERCENVWDFSDEVDGDRYSYGWWDWLPADFVGPAGGDGTPGSGSGYKTAWQIHDDTAIGPPVAQIRYDTDSAKLRLNTGVVDGSGIGTNYVDYPLLATLAKEVKHHWAVEVSFRTGATGFVRVWHRLDEEPWGAPILEVTTIPTLQSPGAGAAASKCYNKKGLYRSPEAITDTYYTGDYRRARSIIDVMVGIQSPDSSMGIWPGSTNFCTNGNAATGATNITTIQSGGGSATTAERETVPFVFNHGTRVKVKTEGHGTGEGVTFRSNAGLQGGGGGVVAGDTFVGSIFLKRSPGQRAKVRVQVRISYTDFTNDDSTQIVYDLTEFGQRYYSNPITANAAKTIDIVRVMVLTTATAQAITFYAGGAQVEKGSVVTPYIHTDGGYASRVASRVQWPVSSVLSPSQGWVAILVRPGWRWSDVPATNPYAWRWRLDDSNEIRLRYDTGSDQWVARRVAGGAGTNALSTAQTFNRGGMVLVVVAWTPTAIKISVDGAPFVSAGDANIPTLTAAPFDVGSNFGTGTNFLHGDVKWLDCGNGTVADADVAALFSTFGHSSGEPAPSDLVWPETMDVRAMWPAEDESYLIKSDLIRFQGFIESFPPTWGVRRNSVTLQANDAFEPLGRFPLPKSNPNLMDYADVVEASKPSLYYPQNDPAGTKMQHYIRRRRVNEVGGAWGAYIVKQRKRRRVTRSEASANIGPAGTYKATPQLGQPGAIIGSSDTSVRYRSAQQEWAAVTLEDDDLGLVRGIETWVSLDSKGADRTFLCLPVFTGAISGLALVPAMLYYDDGLNGFALLTMMDDGDPALRSATVVNTDIVPALGTWYHVFGRIDPAAIGGLGQMGVYVNGIGSMQAPPFGVPYTNTQGGKLAIGRDNRGGGQKYMNGRLAHTAVYERLVTEKRIGAHYESGSQRGFAQSFSGTRIAEILDLVGAWADEERALYPGLREVQPVRQGGQSPLAEIDATAAAEDGLFVVRDGRLTFLDSGYRDRFPYNMIQATFADAPKAGEFLALAPSPIYDKADLVSTVTGTMLGSDETQVVTDPATEDEFLPGEDDLGDLICVSDADVLAICEARLARRKEPTYRIDEMTLEPFRDDALWNQVLAREFQDRVLFVRRGVEVGTAFSQDSRIEHVQDEVDLRTETPSWTTTWKLSPTQPLAIEAPTAVPASETEAAAPAFERPPVSARQPAFLRPGSRMRHGSTL